MSDYMVRKEYDEAITAGERALSCLRTASSHLDSARSWGIVDLLGGGTLSGIVKHSKLNDAEAYLERARNQLRIFEKELKDVTAIDSTNLHIDAGGFLTFADFFFDGMLADYLVQSRINDTRQRVSRTIYQLENILRQLRARRNSI